MTHISAGEEVPLVGVDLTDSRTYFCTEARIRAIGLDVDYVPYDFGFSTKYQDCPWRVDSTAV